MPTDFGRALVTFTNQMTPACDMHKAANAHADEAVSYRPFIIDGRDISETKRNMTKRDHSYYGFGVKLCPTCHNERVTYEANDIHECATCNGIGFIDVTK